MNIFPTSLYSIRNRNSALSFQGFHKNNVETYSDNPLGKLIHTSMLFRYQNTDELAADYLTKQFPSDTLQIISEGCSEGEEVYTLAMIYKERNKPVEITGIDIDNATVKTASEGFFELNSEEQYMLLYKGIKFNNGIMKREQFRKYFAPVHNHNQEVSPENYLYDMSDAFYRKRNNTFTNCKFKQGNVLEAEEQFPQNSMHAIYCRNVLYHMYTESNAENRKLCNKIIKQFSKILKQGGILVFAPFEAEGYNEAIKKALVKNGFECLDDEEYTIWKKT